MRRIVARRSSSQAPLVCLMDTNASVGSITSRAIQAHNAETENSSASRPRRGHLRGWWLDGWMAWRQSGQVVWSLGGYVDWRLCCWVIESSRTENRWHIGRYSKQDLSRLPDPVYQEPWFTSSITNTHYDGFRNVGGQKSFGWRLIDGWMGGY